MIYLKQRLKEHPNLRAEAAKMEKIPWVIITRENAEEVFAKLKEQGKDPKSFGLSDEDYELLLQELSPKYVLI